MRIVTAENKVIYIDPYAGDDYELPADLVLVTHAHFDHSDVDKVQNRASDCQVITHEEAIQDGKHQTFNCRMLRLRRWRQDIMIGMM